MRRNTFSTASKLVSSINRRMKEQTGKDWGYTVGQCSYTTPRTYYVARAEHDGSDGYRRHTGPISEVLAYLDGISEMLTALEHGSCEVCGASIPSEYNMCTLCVRFSR